MCFLGLAALFFVLMYPERVVEVLQMFVDGAVKLAKALSGIDFHDDTVKHSFVGRYFNA